MIRRVGRPAAHRGSTGRDLLPYGMPLEKATHDAWARGHLPAWNEAVSGGRPLLPNPNAGALYPLRPLLSRVPFPQAMRLFPVAHWVLAGWGMLALLSALGASREAGWVAAGTYALPLRSIRRCGTSIRAVNDERSASPRTPMFEVVETRQVRLDPGEEQQLRALFRHAAKRAAGGEQQE